MQQRRIETTGVADPAANPLQNSHTEVKVILSIRIFTFNDKREGVINLQNTIPTHTLRTTLVAQKHQIKCGRHNND